jgi:hypothetical protein
MIAAIRGNPLRITRSRYSPRVRRHAYELVEIPLDRSGATPGLIVDVRHSFARAATRFTHARTRTAGLVGRVSPPMT